MRTKFINIFLRRFKNRIKFLFDIKDLWNWEYESCEKCGSCFRIAYSVIDELWKKVYGSENGCLCLSCFIKMASEKNIFLNKKDFDWLCLYTGIKNNDIINNLRGF